MLNISTNFDNQQCQLEIGSDDYYLRDTCKNKNSAEIFNLLTPSIFDHVPPYINFAMYTDSPRIFPSKLKNDLKWASSFDLANGIARNTGFKIVNEKNYRDSWIGFYNDDHATASVNDSITKFHQKQHTFPGCEQVTEKDWFWRHARRFLNVHGQKDFKFFMETYVLPDEVTELKSAINKSDIGTKWLYKPAAGYESIGIEVISAHVEMEQKIDFTLPAVVQKYLTNAFLLFGRKLEVRVYVLVTCMQPLRIYVYKQGITTLPYRRFGESSKITRSCEFVLRTSCAQQMETDEDEKMEILKMEELGLVLDDNGTTYMWDTESFWHYLSLQGHNVKSIQTEMDDIIIKVLILGQKSISEIAYGNSTTKGKLFNRYNAFQLFAVDFLFDAILHPFVLEVNDYPTLTIGANKIQNFVRIPMLTEVFNVAGFHLPPNLSSQSKIILSSGNNKFTDGNFMLDTRLYELSKYKMGDKNFENMSSWSEDILKNLTSANLRLLLSSEDEFSRTKQFSRIFPTETSGKYLKFMETDLYPNKLLIAWEMKYGSRREIGNHLLNYYAKKKVHL